MTTVGFTSSNWTWGQDSTKTRCMGASLYYRGGLAAAHFRANGLGGWVAERGRSRPDGAMEILSAEDHEWHAPDVIWTEWIGATDEDVETTRKARAAGQIVVGDIDDDVWSVPKTNEARERWESDHDPGYFRQLRACDAVICSTEDLCRKVRERLGIERVYLIRNAIDCAFITPHDPSGLPVSWIGSTPWRANDLRILRRAGLSRWLDNLGEHFYHGGHMQPPEVTDAQRFIHGEGSYYRSPPTLAQQAGLRDDQVVTLPNVPFAEYPRLWDGVGVSLIPLERVPFNYAKSWLKGLESCAAGVPIVASAGFPEYEALEAHGAMIRFCDSPREWRDALDDYYFNDGFRRIASRANREVAERNDIAHRWVEWRAVLADVSGQPLEAELAPR